MCLPATDSPTCPSGFLRPVYLLAAGCLLLNSVAHCRCSSSSASSGRPGLYQRHDELVSSAGEVWAVTYAKPRNAEEGPKRGRGAYACNWNFSAASPLLLPDQEDALQLLLPNYCTSPGSSSSGPAPCTVYGRRATHKTVTAYGVAITASYPGAAGWAVRACGAQSAATKPKRRTMHCTGSSCICSSMLWQSTAGSMLRSRRQSASRHRHCAMTLAGCWLSLSLRLHLQLVP